MTSTEMPSMSFEEGSLHLVLLPELDANPPSLSLSDQNPEFDPLPQLTSARYGDPSPVARPNIQRDLDQRNLEEHEKLGNDAAHDRPSDETASSQNIPVHPIPSLQDAFAESLFEVTGSSSVEKPNLRLLDGHGRREALLAQGKDDAPFDASWRLRPGQKQHEIAKLISQISFGVYLLLDGNANSSVQVVDILQGHIDEVDEFLEVILEDLAEAEKDINTRIDELMLPMANMASFERSLEDRKYRAELLESNQFVEHVIARTNAALRQWEDDIEAGLQTSAAFVEWLNGHTEGTWRAEQPHLLEIFDAMNGNAEGWLLAFEKMSDSAQDMTSLIIKLMNTISEIEKKAGEVSRRTWANNPPFSSPWGPNGRASSRTSTASSLRSYSRSITHGSIRNGSIPKRRPPSSIMSEGSGETIPTDFPLPGCVSLLPPPLRVAPSKADNSKDDGFRLSPATYSPLAKPGPSPTPQVLEEDDEEEVERCEATQSPVYVLQPRTYTPQPPAPLPSPMVKDYSARNTQSSFQSHAYTDSRSSTQSSFSMGSRAQTWQPTEIPQKRISLRQRVSLKASPPQDIRIPSRSLEGMEVYVRSSNNTTPRTTPSTCGSDDYHSQNQHTSASQRSSPSIGFHSTTSSPHADQQFYHPVMASRHSPLQQRPHTAAGSGVPMSQQQSMLVPPPLLRNRPSQLGGMSVASNKTSRSYEGRQDGTGVKSPKSGDKLKKKKSAFGWLKKAFSMDEEERAAYEARKAMQHHDRYYDSTAPKFLDGRRVRR